MPKDNICAVSTICPLRIHISYLAAELQPNRHLLSLIFFTKRQDSPSGYVEYFNELSYLKDLTNIRVNVTKLQMSASLADEFVNLDKKS